MGRTRSRRTKQARLHAVISATTAVYLAVPKSIPRPTIPATPRVGKSIQVSARALWDCELSAWAREVDQKLGHPEGGRWGQPVTTTIVTGPSTVEPGSPVSCRGRQNRRGHPSMQCANLYPMLGALDAGLTDNQKDKTTPISPTDSNHYHHQHTSPIRWSTGVP